MCVCDAAEDRRSGGGGGGVGVYIMDVCSEVRRRWMAGGVLAAVLAAVLAPALGAPGGNYSLHASSARVTPDPRG